MRRTERTSSISFWLFRLFNSSLFQVLSLPFHFLFLEQSHIPHRPFLRVELLPYPCILIGKSFTHKIENVISVSHFENDWSHDHTSINLFPHLSILGSTRWAELGNRTVSNLSLDSSIRNSYWEPCELTGDVNIAMPFYRRVGKNDTLTNSPEGGIEFFCGYMWMPRQKSASCTKILRAGSDFALTFLPVIGGYYEAFFSFRFIILSSLSFFSMEIVPQLRSDRS